MKARLLAVAGAALLLGACSSGTDDGIVVGEVGRDTVVEVVEAPATVTARASASLTAAADGSVASLSVADGATVRAGQELLRIKSPGAEQALQQAREADRQAAQAARSPEVDLDLGGFGAQADDAAEAAFAAAREAAEQIPDETIKQEALARIAAAEAQYAAARAQGQQAAAQLERGLSALGDTASALAGAQRVQTKAAVAAAQSTVDALTVVAPIAGVVTLGGAGGSGSSDLADQLPSSLGGVASLFGGGGGGASTTGTLSVGSPVQSGDVVASIVDAAVLTLAAQVDETDVFLVTPGVTAEIELDAVPGARYTGEVASVDPTPTGAGAGAVSYGVRLTLGGGTDEFGDPAPAPRAGMSAVARLQVRNAEDVLAVPATAVFRDEGTDAVWAVDASGRAERAPVRVGAQGADSVEILDGLKEGQRIVVSGADRVVEGQTVVEGETATEQ